MKILNAVEVLSELYPDNSWFDFTEVEMENSVRTWCKDNTAHWFRQNEHQMFSFAKTQKWAESMGYQTMVVSLF